jgi:hypothetical protein
LITQDYGIVVLQKNSQQGYNGIRSDTIWHMSKLGIYLMMLAVRFSGRRYCRSQESECDVCSKKFVKLEQMEKHRRDVHPDMSPQEAEA